MSETLSFPQVLDVSVCGLTLDFASAGRTADPGNKLYKYEATGQIPTLITTYKYPDRLVVADVQDEVYFIQLDGLLLTSDTHPKAEGVPKRAFLSLKRGFMVEGDIYNLNPSDEATAREFPHREPVTYLGSEVDTDSNIMHSFQSARNPEEIIHIYDSELN
jgi:hypothetical protein